MTQLSNINKIYIYKLEINSVLAAYSDKKSFRDRDTSTTLIERYHSKLPLCLPYKLTKYLVVYY